jgi:hypothetical protein
MNVAISIRTLECGQRDRLEEHVLDVHEFQFGRFQMEYGQRD